MKNSASWFLFLFDCILYVKFYKIFNFGIIYMCGMLLFNLILKWWNIKTTRSIQAHLKCGSIKGFKCLDFKTHLSAKFVNFPPKVFIKESIENRIDDWN